MCFKFKTNKPPPQQVNAQAAGVYPALRAFKCGATRPLSPQQVGCSGVQGMRAGAVARDARVIVTRWWGES